MKLVPSLSINRTVTCADSQVRPAELVVMINVRMFTPSRERLPLGQQCALIRRRLLR